MLSSTAHASCTRPRPVVAGIICQFEFGEPTRRRFCAMESAAKRKAGGAATSETEGRPSKRQKVPVRARPGGECSSVGVCEELQTGWRRFAMRAMRERGRGRGQRATACLLPTATEPPLQPAAMRPPNPPWTCARDTANCHCLPLGPGPRHRSRRDPRDDHHHGLEVPRELEAGKGQDV